MAVHGFWLEVDEADWQWMGGGWHWLGLVGGGWGLVGGGCGWLAVNK